MALVVLMAIGLVLQRVQSAAEKDAQTQVPTPTVPAFNTPVVTAPATVPFTVQTEAFSFVLPATPIIEPLTEFRGDVSVTGTQWTLESDDTPVSALALNLGVVLDEAARQAMVDSMVNNIAGNLSGTITSDTWSTVDGVYQRDCVVTAPDGRMVLRFLGKGTWIVLLFGGSPGAEEPIGLADLFASFSFV